RVGDWVAGALRSVLGDIGSAIALVAAVLLVGLSEAGRGGRVVLQASAALARAAAGVARRAEVALRAGVERWRGWRRARRTSEPEMVAAASRPEVPGAAATLAPRWQPPEERTRPARMASDEALPAVAISEAALPRRRPARPAAGARAERPAPADKRVPLERASLPPMSLLETAVQTEGAGYSRDELKNWSTVVEEKLVNYGVEGRVTAVHHGPVVTTFEFEPAPGVRIKEIVSRADDLALALRARSLRMIAPIPGRAAVGIEIPNPRSRIVYFADVLGEISEKQRLGGLAIAVGVDVVGQPFVMNLCETPHLLIAGTTGSGKSVCLNTILASILFQYRPSDVQLLLVDPKMVELSMYNGIPHLMHRVVTDPKEAAKVLEYLVVEMGRRNEMFREQGVRNIESFNTKVAMGRTLGPGGEPLQRLPYIVVIVDELGDLALAKGVDLETLLARLAQMSRAAGIHMVLATQRPSVDVIIGRTKANFPTRIAFRVATKVDSRTIIDTIGADKLLGRGDMLYMDSQHPQPLRLHGAWLSEREIERLIAHWQSYEFDESHLDLTATRAGTAAMDDDVDPLFADAMGVVVQYRQGSTSLLQRKLHVGYARAARLLDQLEQRGVVGPPEGSKPREVYIDAARRPADE
ncbi:MAG: DNA translocase FtsK, partial [Candidatus Krumholzibacteria bacterium]|nr:DNA translocase FtsK [Candidatus Krumholzibacteria bacterium]